MYEEATRAICCKIYMDWYSTISSGNCQLMFTMTTTYMIALWMFRISLRTKTNFMSMISARHIFSTLVFVTNMTKYQEIHSRDILQFLRAPKSVQTFLMNNQSFSESGHAFNVEGGDFRL